MAYEGLTDMLNNFVANQVVQPTTAQSYLSALGFAPAQIQTPAIDPTAASARLAAGGGARALSGAGATNPLFAQEQTGDPNAVTPSGPGTPPVANPDTLLGQQLPNAANAPVPIGVGPGVTIPGGSGGGTFDSSQPGSATDWSTTAPVDTTAPSTPGAQPNAPGGINNIPSPASAPAPLTQTGYLSPAGINRMGVGIQEEREGLAAGAQAQGEQAAAEQGILSPAIARMQSEQRTAETLRQAATERTAVDYSKYQQAVDEYNKLPPFDANRLMGNMSTLQRIGMALSLGLGQFGASMTHTPNNAMEYVNSLIARDVQTQEMAYKKAGAKIDQAQSLYKMNMDRFSNEELARQATIAQEWNIAVQNSKVEAMKYTNPIARADALAKIGVADQQYGGALNSFLGTSAQINREMMMLQWGRQEQAEAASGEPMPASHWLIHPEYGSTQAVPTGQFLQDPKTGKPALDAQGRPVPLNLVGADPDATKDARAMNVAYGQAIPLANHLVDLTKGGLGWSLPGVYTSDRRRDLDETLSKLRVLYPQLINASARLSQGSNEVVAQVLPDPNIHHEDQVTRSYQEFANSLADMHVKNLRAGGVAMNANGEAAIRRTDAYAGNTPTYNNSKQPIANQ